VVAFAPGLGDDPDLQVGAEAVIAHALLRHLDRQRRIEGGHLDRQRRIEGGQGRAQLVDRCSVRAVELLTPAQAKIETTVKATLTAKGREVVS
jgi:hypothetical protein